MKKDVVEKKMYKGEVLAFSAGKTYKVITEEERNIEILTATSDSIEDNSIRLVIKNDDDFNRYLYKEEDVEITPATPLPKKKEI